TRYYLGRLYVMMNRYGEAISAYEEVIDIDPNFHPAYLELARILGEKEIDVDRALKLARKAVDLKPTAQTFDLLAWLCFKRGMYEEAEKAIERALELAPSDESIIRHRENMRRNMRYR
ncbi:MAG: tetratricopeptide repeat protein, partial [Deltaproteobacteria bacterium]